jgi:hypothetical protein
MTTMTSTSTNQHHQSAVRAMYAGLVLTVAATIAPYVDRATTSALASHIEAGWPAYSEARIDTAVTTWLVILSALGALGVAGWIGTIWAVRSRKGWARWTATTLFALGISTALTLVFITEPTGQQGLPPALAWIGVLPSLAGAVAVSRLWRRS